MDAPGSDGDDFTASPQSSTPAAAAISNPFGVASASPLPTSNVDLTSFDADPLMDPFSVFDAPVAAASPAANDSALVDPFSLFDESDTTSADPTSFTAASPAANIGALVDPFSLFDEPDTTSAEPLASFAAAPESSPHPFVASTDELPANEDDPFGLGIHPKNPFMSSSESSRAQSTDAAEFGAATSKKASPQVPPVSDAAEFGDTTNNEAPLPVEATPARSIARITSRTFSEMSGEDFEAPQIATEAEASEFDFDSNQNAFEQPLDDKFAAAVNAPKRKKKSPMPTPTAASTQKAKANTFDFDDGFGSAHASTTTAPNSFGFNDDSFGSLATSSATAFGFGDDPFPSSAKAPDSSTEFGGAFGTPPITLSTGFDNDPFASAKPITTGFDNDPFASGAFGAPQIKPTSSGFDDDPFGSAPAAASAATATFSFGDSAFVTTDWSSFGNKESTPAQQQPATTSGSSDFDDFDDFASSTTAPAAPLNMRPESISQALFSLAVSTPPALKTSTVSQDLLSTSAYWRAYSTSAPDALIPFVSTYEGPFARAVRQHAAAEEEKMIAATPRRSYQRATSTPSIVPGSPIMMASLALGTTLVTPSSGESIGFTQEMLTGMTTQQLETTLQEVQDRIAQLSNTLLEALDLQDELRQQLQPSNAGSSSILTAARFGSPRLTD